ncbi:MAG: cysteine--tRNA ligase [Anaerolineae bacterium]
MQLYNTLSRQIEPFVPAQEAASVYVCGITPYDTTHLGHAFTYTTIDILIRYLEFQDWPVEYVQNVTDVDDDILRKARETGENWRELGNRWTARYIRDMMALNVRAPDHFPRATEFIPQILDVAERLIDAGVAYESGGSVYFDIDAWPEYGKLSRLSREEMLPIANERGNDPDDPHKRDPLDFVLWQARAAGEPFWDSPWGPGRPGWHIECSTMAVHYLGSTINVHSGGADLAFPHHESEIAQAEGATGQKPFVHTWVHTAMVRHEGEKMSKSLGNLIMVCDLLESWSPDTLRLYTAGHHYRKSWTHNPQELKRADELARTLQETVIVEGGDRESLEGRLALERFCDAMDDDLDTSTAIAHLEHLGKAIQRAARAGRDVRSAQETLRSMAGVLGLRLDAEGPEPEAVHRWNEYLQGFT